MSVTYTAVLAVAEETVLFVSGLLTPTAVVGARAAVGARWAATGRRC
jgi:hypothetical protein